MSGYTFSPATLNPIITTANIGSENFTASAVVASSSSGVAGSFSGMVQ
jgi:glycerol uptake facilitator-like aquaporin